MSSAETRGGRPSTEATISTSAPSARISWIRSSVWESEITMRQR
jgi:hypothetical protein